MIQPSLPTLSNGLRVFSASLLSALMIMMPFLQLAAAANRRAVPGTRPTVRESSKAAAEDLFVNPLPVAGPITATKKDSYPSSPGAAAPGETITYTVDVRNTGATDANSVMFSDTIDANTTLVGGSLKVSPLAIADTYSAIKNTQLVVAAPGVLTNDTGLPAPTAVPIAGGATTQGGTVTLNADGSFTYDPPNATFTGADTFVYTATNSQAPPNPADAQGTVTINVDAAPDVSSTTPTNGALDQATNTDITITFTEAVNVTGNWFQIVCTSSGIRNVANTVVTPNGSNTVFTINPNTDFTQAESCTVTVFAAQVTDQDSNDPPNNMTADYVFTFAMDAAPSVSTTTPTNGATTVATNSNVTVNFSESVNATTSSFTISCATTGAHTYTLSASPNSTFTLNPNADFVGGELCTVTVVAAQISDTDANDPPNNMLADFVFSFTTDAAPSVTATTPTNGATNVPGNTNIDVTFSEVVNATTSSFTISCTTSGAHTFTLSASPNSAFTLNPDTDFVGSETCTVTVVAANVTDQDAGDPPDNMAANFVFSFSIDSAPTVTATTPTNGASQVANNTNISLTFSESVNLGGTPVTISCATSGSHTSVVSASPNTVFTVNPDTDFTNGELCTVTVLAAQVTDNDANDPPDNMAANYVFSFTVDNPPSVTTTTPTNGALNQAASTNIVINFSEPVNATTASFQIECPAPGNTQAFTLSASPASSFTLDPVANLPIGVICTVTVFAAQITDTDSGDPPDNMTADYVFSFSIPPDAVNDARSATGNIRIQTASGSGFSVLTNDIGPGITVTAFDATSVKGGNVSVAANGTFTYNPPPGYTGADTFNYTITNLAGSDSATVTINLSDMIWFIDDSASACTTISAATGCGRLTNPLSTMAAFEAANGNADTPLSNIYLPAAGDHIFIYSGNYTAPLTLENNQRVIGQGATSSLQTLSGVTPATDSDTLPSTGGAKPSITSAGNGFNLVSNNQLYGLHFEDTAGTAINSNANVGTLILGDIEVNNDGANGAGIILDDGGTSVTSSGINFINTRSGVGLSLTNSTSIGAANLTFRSISVGNATADPDPANGIVLNTTGTGGGNGSLIVTGNSAGNCGGTVTVNAVGTPATVGAPVTADCTGGTIQNVTAAGISVTNTKSPSFTRMRIMNSGTDGIFVSTITGFTLDRSYISDSAGIADDKGLDISFAAGTAVNGTIAVSNSYIGPTPHDNFGATISSGTSTWSITSTVLDDSQLNSGFNFELRGSSTVSSFTMDGCVLQNSFADGMQMQPNATATGTITVANIQNNTFQGNNLGLDLNHDGTANVTYRVINNTFRTHESHAINFFSSAVQAPTTGGTLNGRFEGNAIGTAAINDSGSRIGNGLRVNINGGADSTVTIHNNTIRQTPNGRGIEIISRNGTGGLDATLTSNNVDNNFRSTPENGGFSLASIFTQSNCVAVCNTLRSDIRLNTVPGVAPTGELLAGQLIIIETGASTAQLVDTTAPISGTCASELAATNTGNTNASAGCSLIAGPITTVAMFKSQDLNRLYEVAQMIPAAIDSTDLFAAAAKQNPVWSSASLEANTQVVVPVANAPVGLAASANRATFSNNKAGSSVSSSVTSQTPRAASAAPARDSRLEERPATVARNAAPASPHRAQTAASKVRQPLSEGRDRQSAVRSHHAKTARALKPSMSGETVNHTIGTLPAGKAVRITFQVTIDLAFSGTQVSNQGSVTHSLTGSPVVTDDPDTGTADDPTITQVLGPPVANDDNYTAFKNNTLNVPAPGVLANDTGGPLVISGISGCVDASAPFSCATSQGGTVVLESNGSFSYTPATNFISPPDDTFTYTVGADSATVNITVADTSAIYINEVLFEPPGTDAPNEYIELRGPASTTIPAGTYFVAIEGDAADNPGDVKTIINLSGLTFGSNGFLVLLQMSNTYVPAAGATVVTSTTVGFGGLPGSRWSADASATDLPDASVTFMLIQTGTVPTLTDDIDANDDGGFDGTVYPGWSVRDSISAMNASALARAYGAFSFRNTAGTGTGQGGEVIVPFIPSYVGRICDSTGSTAADWLSSGVLGGSAPNWTLGSSTETEPSSFAGNPLDHIGSTNFVNTAPVNTVPGATQNVGEDGVLTFNAGNSNLISIADSDAGTNSVEITLTATNGTMSLSGTSGLTFTPPGAGNDGINDTQMIFTGTITDINTALNGMTFTPTSNFAGAASVQIQTNDQGNTGGAACSTAQSDTDTVNITVNGANDAPVLDNTGNMSLNSIPQDVPPASNPGTLVSDIIASAGGDRITDVDAGAVEGIAVTAVDNTNGTWEFSTNNGGIWTAFGSPTGTTARLLASDANTRVRFKPNLGFSGTVNPGITFRAWDQTSGTNGNTADTSTNGGTTAFSTATETASISISSDLKVQDATVPEPSSGTTNMVFTVTLSSPAGLSGASVDFTTADQPPAANHAVAGTCGAGGDYTPTSGTINFTSGQQVKSINVPVCSDTNNSEVDETFLVNLTNAVNATIVDGTATGTITVGNAAGAFLISELRTSGPNGTNDDFVEVYNNSNSPLTVAATDASAGYGVYKMGSDCNATPVLVGTIPNGTVIPARGHYLLVGSSYSLSSYPSGNNGVTATTATGDATLTADIENDRNVAVFSTSNVANISSTNRLDAVGFGLNTGSNCDLLREGSTLQPVSGSTTQYSFFRKLCDFVGGGCSTPGTPKDTNNNATDFLLADTLGTNFGPGQQLLGAPGPENKTAPLKRDPAVNLLLLDASVASTSAPNRFRDGTAGPNATFGTLSVRRRVINNTGGNVTRLRYRIVEFTTAPSPGGGTADLRALTSVDVSVSAVNDSNTCFASNGIATTPCTVTVKGTTLEEPPNQTIGGGMNSTLSSGTVTLGTPLANGASINVQFLLGVQTPGTFRFLIIVEALP